jgi:sarcosine oxidase subunit delta
MRLPCPFCGERDAAEFTYRGDAAPARPDTGSDAEAWYDYVYLRDNPAGPIRELWFHRAGCQSWIVVERDTRTHAVSNATLATGEANR